MSEFHHHPETAPNTPETTVEHQKSPVETTDTHPEQAAEVHSIERIRETIESHAMSTEAVSQTVERPEDQPAQQAYGVQRELKAQAYQRTLSGIRRQLPAPERAFSRIIHNPIVETASNIAAASIGRSSGILAGSIITLTGSAVVLYASKHYGFRYNYALVFGFFFIGYVIGVLIEAIAGPARKRRTENM